MTQTIRLQSDSNAHDRPWRVAVEQGFFAAEGLNVEYHEDNPKGAAGRVEDFSKRWKESQLRNGALEVYPVCEWGAIERVATLGGGKIIGLDTTVRTGALMVRKDSKIQTLGFQRLDRRDQACACQRSPRCADARHDRSRRADGAVGQPRGCRRRPQARRLTLARRHRRRR